LAPWLRVSHFTFHILQSIVLEAMHLMSPKNGQPVCGRRVPSTLQAVIVSSNRDREVSKPPPDAGASKTFSPRKWFGLGRLDDGNDTTESPSRSLRTGGKPKLALSPRRRGLPFVPNVENNTFVPKPISPQVYFESVLQSRGHSTKVHHAKKCAYYSTPTPLQQASYGAHVVELIRENDARSLRELLEVGLSPNAANAQNESIVHLACRLGHAGILRVLIEFGCKVLVSDDNGRTPMHEACWSPTPSFEIVEILLQKDRQILLVADTRGDLPLTYVKDENWSAFTSLIVQEKDIFWPDKLFGEPNRSGKDLLSLAPNSVHIRDPKKPLSVHMAKLLAQGKMTPGEVDFLTKGMESGSVHTSDSDYESEDEHDFMDDDENSIDSGISFNQAEMATLLASIGSINRIDW
jgi:hypothetical protein